MANPPGSDRDAETARRAGTDPEPTAPVAPMDHDDAVTDRVGMAPAEADPPTEILGNAVDQPTGQPERRFTAPGFDASATQVIVPPPPDPATEVFAPQRPAKVLPQAIPPRSGRLPSHLHNSWGWVLALTLIILALAAIAVLGTVLMTRADMPAASQEDQVRETIRQYDLAMQKGDLTTLRSITCGATRDNYVNYDDDKWADIHQRVKKADRYPMVASVDEIVINGEHAEANVTAFMAYAPSARSTRSIDLQFRDDQWKICQAPAG